MLDTLKLFGSWGVEPFIALALTGGLVWGFATGKVDGAVYLPIVTMALAFYFGKSRSTG